MPKIWKTIEMMKNDEDLRHKIHREWKRHQGDINDQYLDIYWPEDMVKCICRTQFVKSGLATFINVESGISILNLLPRSHQEDFAWKRK